MGYVKASSTGKFFFSTVKGPILNMQTIQETRRQRLGMLKAQYGRWSELNVKIGWERTSARLSQIHSGTIRSDRGTPYTMGDDTAREIEKSLELEEGWMDTPPSLAEQFGHSEPLDKMAALLSAMEPEMQYQAVRLVAVFAQPHEGTNGAKRE
jgi:hypothetical protein